MTGRIHSIETFGSVDGPGVRFVAFLQGCRMRCQFCHNPDTWRQDAGESYTAQELLDRAVRYRSYWGKDGGITVSGGEPMLQMEFVTELFYLAKQEGIHTTLDTSGNPFTREEPFFTGFRKLMEVTDLVMLDIKQIDEEAHKTLTGWSNQNILDMAVCLSEWKKPVWIRHVLVPGGSCREDYLQRLRAFLDTLTNIEKIEVLPYHTLGVFKWKELGIPYPLESVEQPTAKQIAMAERILKD